MPLGMGREDRSGTPNGRRVMMMPASTQDDQAPAVSPACCCGLRSGEKSGRSVTTAKRCTGGSVNNAGVLAVGVLAAASGGCV
jgi:hypothetical protein